jgi:hypothetical protein
LVTHPYEAHARVVCQDGDDDWLTARRLLITASDSAAITGDIEFRGTQAEQAEKAAAAYSRVITQKVQGIEFTPNLAMFFGKYRESSNIDIFAELSGLTVQRDGNLYESIKYPWIGCTLDARVVAVDRLFPIITPDYDGVEFKGLLTAEELDTVEDIGNVVVEMKNVRSRYRSLVKDKVPTSRYCQAQVQMLVTGSPIAILCSAVDACEMYPHLVWADEEYQQRFIECSKRAHEEVASWM